MFFRFNNESFWFPPYLLALLVSCLNRLWRYLDFVINAQGEGTYGKVYKARDRRNGKLVALKKTRLEVRLTNATVDLFRYVSIMYHNDFMNPGASSQITSVR